MQTVPTFRDAIGLVVEPMDTWLFRDGRPFGLTDQADTLMTPLPQTVAGMIQTHLMQAFDVEYRQCHDLAGQETLLLDQRALSLVATRGPWWAKARNGGMDAVYVNAPANLARTRRDTLDSLRILTPVEDHEKVSPGWAEAYPPRRSQGNMGDPLWPLVCEGANITVASESSLLDPIGLRDYLAGKTPNAGNLRPLAGRPDGSEAGETRGQLNGNLCFREHRANVAIQPESGTVQRGNLFGSQRARPAREIVLYCEIGLEDHPTDKQRKALSERLDVTQRQALLNRLRDAFESAPLLNFGGEGGLARVRALDKPWDWTEATETIAPGDTGDRPSRFYTLLITPALFADPYPWRPGKDGPGILRAAAVQRLHRVSGWALAFGTSPGRGGGIPRPLRYAAPAGSVYFWEKGKHSPSPAPTGLVQLSARPEDRAKGWGMALVGQW